MPKILYIDMDNVLVDFRSALTRVPPELLQEYEGRLDEVPGIFSLMDPVPYAIDSFQQLAEQIRHLRSVDITVGESVRMVGQIALGETPS